jgi:hypothetical protein
MDEQERAKQIARLIQDALASSALAGSAPAGTAEHPQATALPATTPGTEQESAAQAPCNVTRENGCLSCDPGACWVCGYLFTGERILIRHPIKGERVLSDRTVHLLSHGIVRYKTQYVIRGEAVIVDLDLDELAGYFDL